MASLKEVKDRIATVTSTRKITSAMKMIASAKLHKAQTVIENMLPYQRGLNGILLDFLRYDDGESSVYAEKREVRSVAVVVFSSNASLVGGFNGNVIRRLTAVLDGYRPLGMENVHIYPVGKKVAEAVVKLGFKVEGDYTSMAEKPSYGEAAALADRLMGMFAAKNIDRVELLYHHFHSTAVQVLTQEDFLPIALPEVEKEHSKRLNDFILEPSPAQIMGNLVPKVLLMKMYTVLLDSNASEHAARTMAMQLATDNANELLQDLTLQYNKTRQQAITNELLDIVGGSMK